MTYPLADHGEGRANRIDPREGEMRSSQFGGTVVAAIVELVTVGVLAAMLIAIVVIVACWG